MATRAAAPVGVGVVTPHPTNTTNLLLLLHHRNLSFPSTPRQHHHINIPLLKTPPLSTIISHSRVFGLVSQLDGSASGVEAEEEIGESFFDDSEVILDDSDEDDDDAESSLDLLVRFLHSMFKKLSKRAKKATRSMLPAAISPQLFVCFDDEDWCPLQLTEFCYWPHFLSSKHFFRWFAPLEAVCSWQSCSYAWYGQQFPTFNRLGILFTRVEAHTVVHSQWEHNIKFS
ncbi:hypothetical protein Tsubulata_032760 [Turnera subulata]|uniref:Uncharacterized protein n=1 Tax=Turnera subulata TaxID=218843 RepID=A0A9Q0GN05_9ROSI|nr:hypothetical protein Tsubulata_032760 [Turnera subulata]